MNFSIRTIMSWAMMLAGVAMLGYAAWLTCILVYGPWSPTTEAARVQYLGQALLASIGGAIGVIIGMAIGGPVGRVSGEAGTFKIEVDGDE